MEQHSAGGLHEGLIKKGHLFASSSSRAYPEKSPSHLSGFIPNFPPAGIRHMPDHAIAAAIPGKP
ncbi:MAG: hypothetical protein ABJA60_06340, partial [Nitrosospira sp.]